MTICGSATLSLRSLLTNCRIEERVRLTPTIEALGDNRVPTSSELMKGRI